MGSLLPYGDNIGILTNVVLQAHTHTLTYRLVPGSHLLAPAIMAAITFRQTANARTRISQLYLNPQKRLRRDHVTPALIAFYL